MFSRMMCLALAVVAPTVAAADDWDWAYKDWTVSRYVAEGDSAGQYSCEMSEVLPGNPGLRISYAYGAAGDLPSMALFPMANVGPMAVPETVPSRWVFDGVTDIAVILNAEYRDQVNRFDAPSEHTGPLLHAMAAGNVLIIRDEVFERTDVSLSGFAAVYRKMSAWCGVTLDGVMGG